MKATTVIINIMKAQNITQAELARKLGVKTQSVVSGRLRNGNITTANTIEMLDKLDYEVYAVPKGYTFDSDATTKPIKLTVSDEDDIVEEDPIIAAYKSKLTPDLLADFESKPIEVQIQIAALMA